MCAARGRFPRRAGVHDALVQRIRASAQFAQASTFIESDYDRFVKELIALNEIPAPPFKEQARAKAYVEMLRQQGLSDVEMDAEGNAMGVRKGSRPADRWSPSSLTSTPCFPKAPTSRSSGRARGSRRRASATTRAASR